MNLSRKAHDSENLFLYYNCKFSYNNRYRDSPEVFSLIKQLPCERPTEKIKSPFCYAISMTSLLLFRMLDIYTLLKLKKKLAAT